MSIDILPSTFDGTHSDEDGVLDILKNARARYAEGAINGSYIIQGSVCAVGALGVAFGLTASHQFGGGPSDLLAQVEADLRDDARAAIRLVEKAAVTLFPELKEELEKGRYAIEELNENEFFGVYEWPDDDDYDYDDEIKFWEARNKQAVLACYDYAIVRRQVEILRELYL